MKTKHPIRKGFVARNMLEAGNDNIVSDFAVVPKTTDLHTVPVVVVHADDFARMVQYHALLVRLVHPMADDEDVDDANALLNDQ